MPNLVPFQHPGPNDPSVPMSQTLWNSFLTTVNDEFDNRTPESVKGYGALGDGTTDDKAAFESANASEFLVTVPDSTYVLSSAPTLTKVFEFSPGAFLTGAGALSFGYAEDGGKQTIQTATTADEFSTRYIRRNANHTGGTPGFASSGLRVDTYVSAGVANFEWTATFVCDNSATGGENVGLYAQGIKRSTGPTWGSVSEIVDHSAANPTSGAVGQEISFTANGTDNNNTRVGLDIALRKRDTGGATVVASWGGRIQNNGTDKFKTGWGSTTGTRVEVGFDASTMVAEIAAFKMAANQAFIGSADNTKAFVHTGGAWSFQVSGAEKVALLDTGGVSVLGNQIIGARQPAIASMTGSETLLQTQTKINEVIQMLRNHGIIAT